MEMEWVHQVPYDEKKAEQINKLVKKLRLSLSIHGSYYVNLASFNKKIWHSGISRLVKAAKIGSNSGAKKLTFHAGFYQGMKPSKVSAQVEKGIEEILTQLDALKIDMQICPETTGKPTQFGSLEELVKLAKKYHIGLCIDFSHLHARSNGKFNSIDEFNKILDLVEKTLGRDYLSDMYFHLSGILYGQKGERRHVCLLEKFEDYSAEGIKILNFPKNALREVDFIKDGPDMLWRDILICLKNRNVGGTIVIESPSLELDTLLAKRFYQAI